MPPIISAQGLSKRYGVAPLFKDISFTVSEGDRIGIIGPNGSGKSTLLAMLNGTVSPDSGDVAVRKGMRLSAVQQISEFGKGETIRSVIDKALDRAKVTEDERRVANAEILGRAGFTDLDAAAATLSGGWRKRLAIVEALVQRPDILLLDEPTNHLDLAGIEWLEDGAAECSVCLRGGEPRPLFSGKCGEWDCGSEFCVRRRRSACRRELQHIPGGRRSSTCTRRRNRQSALENRVHTEIDWLRRGPKARTTKSKARIDTAHELIGELGEMKARTRKHERAD